MRWLIALSAALAVTAVAASSSERPLERPRIVAEAKRVPDTRETAFLPYWNPPDPLAAVALIAEVEAYLAAEHERQLAEFYASVQAELDRQAAARRPAVQARPSGTVGECTGFAIPDYIIQRESGGNPSAMNPSGAYGCAQTLLSHYSSGSCRGLDPYTIDGQRACVAILSNGGTNLAPWAATR